MLNNNSSEQNKTNFDGAGFYILKVQEFCSSNEVEKCEKQKLLSELPKLIRSTLLEKGMTKEEIEEGINKAKLELKENGDFLPIF